ncbi:MAG TPA: hypothetical protein VMA37_00995 [Acetobacteraceae bacterium]|nr:hypothetical protein [Acetobacteraceae bacterium]
MALMIIHHRVRDYVTWRPFYDAHEGARAAATITNGKVFRGADDPNDILILFEIVDPAKAQAFGTSEDLKSTMNRAGVIGAPAIHMIG